MSFPRPVTRYRLAWDPVARRGEAVFAVDSDSAIPITALSADEFGAMNALLSSPNVEWDGRYLRASHGDWRSDSVVLRSSRRQWATFLEVDPAAQRLVDECESEWPVNKSDCSGFVKDVAAQFGVTLKGLANDIVDAIHGAGWAPLSSGVSAKEQADAGKLVVGGLRGDHQDAGHSD